MATVLLYSDPHFGLERKANFTKRSADLRDRNAIAELDDLIDRLRPTRTVCGGDFFDRFSNPEEVLIRTLGVAKKTDFILTGNHDVSNRVGQASSLGLYTELGTTGACVKQPNEPLIEDHAISGAHFIACPHVLTQELFEQQLERAIEAVSHSERWRYLLLHCNYNLGFETSDSTLNLSEEWAQKLLGHFHKIFIGHEHTHRSLFDDRLIIIGSWRPTAFDNMDDKYVIKLDTVSGEMEKVRVWSRAEKFLECNASQFVVTHGVEYYLIHDDLQVGEVQPLVLQAFENGAYGVKVPMQKLVMGETGISREELSMSRLPDIVERELKEGHENLLPYWSEAKEESMHDH